jgi:hypothetical protein
VCRLPAASRVCCGSALLADALERLSESALEATLHTSDSCRETDHLRGRHYPPAPFSPNLEHCSDGFRTPLVKFACAPTTEGQRSLQQCAIRRQEAALIRCTAGWAKHVDLPCGSADIEGSTIRAPPCGYEWRDASTKRYWVGVPSPPYLPPALRRLFPLLSSNGRPQHSFPLPRRPASPWPVAALVAWTTATLLRCISALRHHLAAASCRKKVSPSSRLTAGVCPPGGRSTCAASRRTLRPCGASLLLPPQHRRVDSRFRCASGIVD